VWVELWLDGQSELYQPLIHQTLISSGSFVLPAYSSLRPDWLKFSTTLVYLPFTLAWTLHLRTPPLFISSAVIAHPTELIKCKLQLQLIKPDNVPKDFKNPFDVVRQTVQAQGATGMWKGMGASFVYRTCFAAMFGGMSSPPCIETQEGEWLLMPDLGFEIFNRLFKSWDGTSWEMSTAAANFWAGGIASNMYWFAALRETFRCNTTAWSLIPRIALDTVKNRIMGEMSRKIGVQADRIQWTISRILVMVVWLTPTGKHGEKHLIPTRDLGGIA
jgi:hypothetical protein